MTNGLTSPRATDRPPGPAPDAARGAPPPSDAFAGMLDAQQARTATAEGQNPEKPAPADDCATPAQASGEKPATDPATASDTAATAAAAVLAALPVPVTPAAPTPAAPTPATPVAEVAAAAVQTVAVEAAPVVPATPTPAVVPTAVEQSVPAPAVAAVPAGAPVDAAPVQVPVAKPDAPVQAPVAQQVAPSQPKPETQTLSSPAPAQPVAATATPQPTAQGQQEQGQQQSQSQPQQAPAAPAAPQAPAAPAAVATAARPAPTPIATPVPLSRAAEAVEHVLHVVASSGGVTHARIALHPAELGSVDLHIRSTAEGLVARVVAHTAEAVQTLQHAANDLRQSLEEQGLNLMSLDIGQPGEPGAGRAGADAGGQLSGGGEPEAAETDDTATQTSTLRLPTGVLVDVLA